jgi:putative DNA primase/helicase
MDALTSNIPFPADAIMTRHIPQNSAEPHTVDLNQPLILDARDPMAIARRFISDKFTIKGRPALHRYREEFFEFSVSCYCSVDNETMRGKIWSYLERANKVENGGYAPFKPKKGQVDNVFDALKGACNLNYALEAPAWLNNTSGHPPAAEFLPLSNGLLHLPTGELHPPSPLYFGRAASDVTYDANAPEPNEWLKFLDALFGNDTASIELLQDMIGYGLASDTSLQKIMLLVGPSRSGKGTIATIIKALVGDNNVVGPTMASLSQNFGLAPLIGKTVAIIADARIGGRADLAMIAERLLSISGEDTQTIDRKFKEPWTGRLPTRFFIMTNELPRLTDHSGALANRFIPLVMKRSFLGKEDHGLRERLRHEYSGILNWALAGYCRLRERRRFVQAESGRETIRELEELASPVKAFVAEKCELRGQVKIEDAYRVWRLWCQDNGYEPGAKNTFGRSLRAAIPELEMAQLRVDGDLRQRFYIGIRLKSEREP